MRSVDGDRGGGVTDAIMREAFSPPVVEQGWSRRRDRKIWRFLARKVPTGRLPLRGSAVASLTFDDIPDSAARVGAPLLERHGVRGTFYVAADLCGQRQGPWRMADRGEVRALAEAGHEIGCHTARHLNVQSLSRAELMGECDRSRDLIAGICGREPRHFCYPFGDVGLLQKQFLAQRFETCRSIYERPNLGRVDPALLGAVGLFDATLDRERLLALVRATLAGRGWLILYTHDVDLRPTPIGCSPSRLDEVLQVLSDHGLPVLTMSEAARHHGLAAS